MKGGAKTFLKSKPRGVKSIVLVSSTKGGVGKSTVAVNLALALGRSVSTGLVDLDVFGPSLPRLLNLRERPEVDERSNFLLPLRNFGLQCMSMGFLTDSSDAVVWRGPLVMSAVDQLLFKVKWSALDVLVVDMPPGTGDAPLSIAQRVEVDGALVVSTPQHLALDDVRRGVQMMRKVGIPMLGLVENMAGLTCPHCRGEIEVLGASHVHEFAEEAGLDVLARVPMDLTIRQGADEGKPVLVTQPESLQSKLFVDLAKKVMQRLKIE